MSEGWSDSIPVTILGGSDRRPGRLPGNRPDLHALSTYKGVAVKVDGRPLIEVLCARLAAARGFGPIAVAGPARVYAALDLDAHVVDTDGTVGDNVRAAFVDHEQRLRERGVDPRARAAPLGILACDVLPTVDELNALRALAEQDGPCALWLPFVREPEDPSELGAFAWKPRYRIAPTPGAPPERILPGHLAIVEPSAIRLGLLDRLLRAAYRSRNSPIRARKRELLRTVIGSLVARDLAGLARLRGPRLTSQVLGAGLRLARRLRAGELDAPELERLVARILVRRGAPPDRRRVRLPHTDALHLAEDIDTEEEARDIGCEVAATETRLSRASEPG